MSSATPRSAAATSLPRTTSGDRCLVMGIVNVTPDSFSDGGRFCHAGAAVEHALGLVRQSADLVDVGGESTRPGAARVSEEEELRRVVPVVEALSGAGAQVMQQHAVYGSVVEDVRSELARRCEAALSAGVREDRIVLDPGLGFAKTSEHSWSVLAGLPRLLSLGFPLPVGASRNRFLAECVDYGGLDGARPEHREDVSAAVATIAAASGVWGIRVHAVAPAAAASRTVSRLRGAGAVGHATSDTAGEPSPTA